MHSRILRMQEWTGLIAERAPAIKEERANTLRERLGEVLAQSGQELEETRLLQEVVILADRLDVSEELTRLNTHLERWAICCKAAATPGGGWISPCRNASARSTPAATSCRTCNFPAWWWISKTNWKNAASRSRTWNDHARRQTH